MRCRHDGARFALQIPGLDGWSCVVTRLLKISGKSFTPKQTEEDVEHGQIELDCPRSLE